jgi:beta-galactosidase GanA
LYYVEADLDETKDTYIDVSEFQKGYVWVNGHNLGRYWNIGPQQRLYCPGVWLNKGKNKILILDLFEHNKTVTIKAYHNLA